MDTMAWTIPADVAAPPPPPLGLLEALTRAEAAATAAARAATPTAAAGCDEDDGPGSPCSAQAVPSTGALWGNDPRAAVEPACRRCRLTTKAQARRAVAPRTSPASPTAAAGLGCAPGAAGNALTDGPLALPPSVAPPTTPAAPAARPRLRRRQRVAGSVVRPSGGGRVGRAAERPVDGGES